MDTLHFTKFSHIYCHAFFFFFIPNKMFYFLTQLQDICIVYYILQGMHVGYINKYRMESDYQMLLSFSLPLTLSFEHYLICCSVYHSLSLSLSSTTVYYYHLNGPLIFD